ncbi:hypothetical protein KP509_1Z122200 [Ceratopteris richardii]|nr:hypothetical protein KP509_1Z122200 [Ceratopteris richardii]
MHDMSSLIFYSVFFCPCCQIYVGACPKISPICWHVRRVGIDIEALQFAIRVQCFTVTIWCTESSSK